MALIDIKLYSEALGMQTEVYVVIPQKSTQGEMEKIEKFLQRMTCLV